MKWINKCLAICVLFAISLKVTAQTILHIGDGGNVYIPAGANVSFDSLVLHNVEDVLLSANDITKSKTVTHKATGNYISRVYSFSAPVNNYLGDIGILYKNDELNGIYNSDLLVDIYNDTGWMAFTNSYHFPIQNINYTAVSSVARFSLEEITLASRFAVLPLQWISVQAMSENGFITVKWITVDEVNSKVYQVQRSNDAATWQNVGAPLAATNRVSFNNYSLIDATVLNGTTYYRIVQTDASGKLSYSSVVSVKNIVKSEISIYPIPAISIINVRANDNTAIKRVRLLDAAGTLLIMKEGSNSNEYSFNLSGLASGFYMLSIETSNGKITKGFLKK